MAAKATLGKTPLLAASLLLPILIAAAWLYAIQVSRSWAQPSSTGNSSGGRTIDPDRSGITVHVFKAGLFSAFGHEHEISAPIQEGSFNEEQPSVDLLVDSRKLRVLDQNVSDKDRAEIQSTMLGPKILDSERFPEIRFHSTRIDRLAEGRWIVHGELTIRGQPRPVKVDVEGQGGRFRGSTELRQKEFGITPFTAAGGTVKVKNEIRVTFDIIGK